MKQGDCNTCKHYTTGLTTGYCRYCGIISKNWEIANWAKREEKAMETSVIEKNGKKYTRFKVATGKVEEYKRILEKYVDPTKPKVTNSNYTYYECEGDILNEK